MNTANTSPELEQMRIRGRYEQAPTDTTFLSSELARPQDLYHIIDQFDSGLTDLRDVGSMVTTQRDIILDAYQNGTLDRIAVTHPELLSRPVRNLHKRVTIGEKDQPIGHNFFVNATGFIGANLPWAKQFDELIHSRTNLSIYDIVRTKDNASKDRLLALITDNPDKQLETSLTVYLAGRSLAGENFLRQNYGDVLDYSKNQVFATSQKIAKTTGLRADMLNRLALQVQRATFGSFDHLVGLVTSANSGAAGDYSIGTLRVEVHFDGNVRSAEKRSKAETFHILSHELHHAGSAQTIDGYRCGLQTNGQGLEVNEGMTEYLAQLSAGCPNIKRLPNGHISVERTMPYAMPVTAILSFHQQYNNGANNHFATLFNAYHGDAQSQAQLEQALDAFYQLDSSL